MSISLAVSLEQVKSLVQQCSLEEKIELARFLDMETFETRFGRLLRDFKTDELSIEDITREVEMVRKNRYENAMPDCHLSRF